jgi:hypothetical protein
MIEESKLVNDLLAAGFDTGWAVRGEKIVLWINEEPIPAKFADFVELDQPNGEAE